MRKSVKKNCACACINPHVVAIVVVATIFILIFFCVVFIIAFFPSRILIKYGLSKMIQTHTQIKHTNATRCQALHNCSMYIERYIHIFSPSYLRERPCVCVSVFASISIIFFSTIPLLDVTFGVSFAHRGHGECSLSRLRYKGVCIGGYMAANVSCAAPVYGTLSSNTFKHLHATGTALNNECVD